MEKKSSNGESVQNHSIPSHFFVPGGFGLDKKAVQGDDVGHVSAPYHVYDDESLSGPSHSPTHWSVAWSDLMMTMFILFVVMFAYLSFNKDFLNSDGLGDGIGMNIGAGKLDMGGGGEEGEQVSPGSEAMTKIFDISKHTLRKEVEDSFASIELVKDKTIRIILTGDLLFDLARSDLKEPAKESLSRIGALLQQNPYMINISGHTDNLPIETSEFPSNWELSLIRASKVGRFLIDEVGIAQRRIYITGHASNKPVKPNNTPRNRAINRRVELIITKEIPEPYQDSF